MQNTQDFLKKQEKFTEVANFLVVFLTKCLPIFDGNIRLYTEENLAAGLTIYTTFCGNLVMLSAKASAAWYYYKFLKNSMSHDKTEKTEEIWKTYKQLGFELAKYAHSCEQQLNYFALHDEYKSPEIIVADIKMMNCKDLYREYQNIINILDKNSITPDDNPIQVKVGAAEPKALTQVKAVEKSKTVQRLQHVAGSESIIRAAVSYKLSKNDTDPAVLIPLFEIFQKVIPNVVIENPLTALDKYADAHERKYAHIPAQAITMVKISSVIGSAEDAITRIKRVDEKVLKFTLKNQLKKINETKSPVEYCNILDDMRISQERAIIYNNYEKWHVEYQRLQLELSKHDVPKSAAPTSVLQAKKMLKVFSESANDISAHNLLVPALKAHVLKLNYIITDLLDPDYVGCCIIGLCGCLTGQFILDTHEIFRKRFKVGGSQSLMMLDKSVQNIRDKIPEMQTVYKSGLQPEFVQNVVNQLLVIT